MSYLDWHVGMKVVCIGDFSAIAKEEFSVVFGIEYPEQGAIYTIREVLEVDPERVEDGTIGIRLKEILNLPNPNRAGGGRLVDREVVFHPQDFRPLQATQTSIEVFERLLTGSKSKVPA